MYYLKYYVGGDYIQHNPETCSTLDEARKIADKFIMDNKADYDNDVRVDVFDEEWEVDLPTYDYRTRMYSEVDEKCLDYWMKMGTYCPLYEYLEDW